MADKILIVTGHPDSIGRIPEVLPYRHFDTHYTWECEPLSPYPLGVGGATGGTFSDGTVMICGGRQGSLKEVESACYILTRESRDFVPGGQLATPRYLAASTIVYGATLMITGGLQKKDER